MKTFKFLAAIAATLVIGSAANAASVTCGTELEPAITTNPGYADCYDVTAATGLFKLYGNESDVYDPNDLGLFGKSDWTQVLPGDGQSQTMFAFPEGDWDALALLIKGGTGIVALLYETDTLNAWMNAGDLMITEMVNSSVSGFRLMGREGVSEVPLPAAGWMLIAGLGGLVALRRRKTA